jgi:pimeloyl-ACP methyl ester carboxylesterase
MDRFLTLRDGRTLCWREWGVAGGRPVLRVQGTPGSRLSRHADPTINERLGIRVIMADRPGYGGSSRLPGRGIAAVADDLAELLDSLGAGAVPVAGGSGGGPHVLALAARHPDLVAAASVVVGAAPLDASEEAALTPLNAAGLRAARTGNWDDMRELLEPVREQILADPLAGLRSALAGVPDSDRAIMADPAWQAVQAEGVTEALRPGVAGWVDESLAVLGEWDFDLSAVRTPVVWWHGRSDANAPLTAAQRLVARLPAAHLNVWADDAGHLASYRHEGEILAELLARAG